MIVKTLTPERDEIVKDYQSLVNSQLKAVVDKINLK